MSSAACALSAPAWGAPSDSILRCFQETVQPHGFGVGVGVGLGFAFAFAFAFGFGVGVGVGFGDGSGFSVGVGVGAGVGAAVTAGVGVGPAGGLGETGAVGTSVDPGGRGDASVAASGNGVWWITPESMVWPVRLIAWKYMSAPSISTSMNE